MSALRSGHRASAVAIALLSTSVLVSAHVYALTRPGLRGPVLVLDHLFEAAVAAALLALSVGLGLRVSRRLRDLHDSATEALAFGGALGVGLLGTALMLLGAAGGFRSAPMALLLAACAALAWRELRGIPGMARDALREISSKAGPVSLTVLGAVGLSMLVLASVPPTDYDTLMYHLQIPSELLEHGRVHVPAGNLHVSYVGPVHFLYVPLLDWGAAAAPALINAAFALMTGAVLLTAGARLFSPAVGRVALVLLWGSPALILVGITPRVDAVLACYLLLGHYALLRALGDRERSLTWIVLSGAILGVAVGVKHLAVGYVLALAPLALLVALSAAGTRRRAAAIGAWAAAGLLCGLPWLIKNQVLFGAPFYPQLAADILPPWLAVVHGSQEIPASVDPASLTALRQVREPFSLIDWFLAPERMTPEGEGTAYGANRALLLLLLFPVLMRDRRFWAVLLPGVLFVAAVLIHNSSLNIRYLTPALVASTLAVACILVHLSSHSTNRALRALLLVGVALFTLAPTLETLTARLRGTGALTYAAGVMSKQEYLENPDNPEARDFTRMTERVNELTSSGDRILMLFESRGHGFEAETLPDNMLRNWSLLAPAVERGGCADASGATHVLLAERAFAYYRVRGLDPTTLGWQRFGDFAARCLTPIERRDGWLLFRMRGA